MKPLSKRFLSLLNILAVVLAISFLVFMVWNETYETRLLYVWDCSEGYVSDGEETFIGEGFKEHHEYAVKVIGFSIPQIGLYRRIERLTDE